MITSEAPARSDGLTEPRIAFLWNIGAATITRSDGDSGQYFWLCSIPQIMPPWVSAMPLGVPVEPEV